MLHKFIKHPEKFKELAPYFLHLAMVLSVGVYVMCGAYAIRAIEAELKDDHTVSLEEHHSAKAHSHSDIELTLRRRRSAGDEHPIRHQSMSRARECVMKAMRKLAQQSNCTQGAVQHIGVNIIDRCYEKDLRRIAETMQHHKSEAIVPTISPRNSSSDDSDGEYEYWSLMDSILFCFTVITTIGYGNVAPKTFNGRLFVIIYGLIGVPFTMLAIANLGKFLATLLKSWTRPFIRLFAKCFRQVFRKKKYSLREKQRLVDKDGRAAKAKCIEEDSASEDGEGNNNQPVAEEEEEDADSVQDAIVLFLSFVVYIVTGSLIIAAYEPDMDFFEAIYFNFVTLTTIGLGDIVPQSESYLVFTLLYCAVGLALTTIAIEIAADTLKKLHYFGRKMENVQNVQIWFGGQKISMKALVKNLGDQFNVPVDQLENLNIDNFVDNAIKVEAGELATLRQPGFEPYMTSDYWRALESNSVVYADEDDLLTLQSNRSYQQLLTLLSSRSASPHSHLVIHENAACVHTETIPEEETVSQRSVSLQWTPRNATFCSQPLSYFPDPPVKSDERERQLIKEWKKWKRESARQAKEEARRGKWSEEARRRYEEYQKQWNKFKHTRSSGTGTSDSDH